MARTVETEVVDSQETVSVEASERRDLSGKSSGVARAKVSRWIFLVVAGLAVVGASLSWLHSQNYESTDDAQVEGHLDLAMRVSAEL
jgi:multidrug resistance efflux pump